MGLIYLKSNKKCRNSGPIIVKTLQRSPVMKSALTLSNWTLKCFFLLLLITQNGGLSAVPFICAWLFKNVSANLCDRARAANLCSNTTIRKIFCTVGEDNNKLLFNKQKNLLTSHLILIYGRGVGLTKRYFRPQTFCPLWF